MIRNILAVVAGFAVWTVLFLSINAAIQAAAPESFRADGSTESTGLLVLFLVLSVGYSLLAGYVCALLVRGRPKLYVLALGVVLLAVGIMAQLQYWEAIPLWYHLFFLALLLPVTMLGGRLRLGRAVAGA